MGEKQLEAHNAMEGADMPADRCSAVKSVQKGKDGTRV